MIAGQLWEAAARDLDGLDERIGSGDLAPLGEWLREKVHRHGRRLSPAEVLEGAGCGRSRSRPCCEHLEGAGSGRGGAGLRPREPDAKRRWLPPARSWSCPQFGHAISCAREGRGTRRHSRRSELAMVDEAGMTRTLSYDRGRMRTSALNRSLVAENYLSSIA